MMRSGPDDDARVKHDVARRAGTPRARCVLAALSAGLVVAAATTPARADENDWLRPLGPPPKASPRRISGGEAFPPLPLPATPLRRSERKREPTPPTLVGKIVWGETAQFTYDDGARAEVADWNQCPGDIQSLLRKAGGWFGLSYSQAAMTLAEFDGDPEKTPVLLLNGSRTLRLPEEHQARLRAYVLRGGMVVFDSIAGSPYFADSARRLAVALFPDYGLRRVPADHPLYHMLYDVKEVAYPRNLESRVALLEAVYVGSRIGVLISPYGLGCGWDDREVPLLDQAVYYDIASANRIGLNLIAYAVGYAQAGRDEARPELFGTLDEQRPTDEFVFAQIRHDGAWNVHPGSAAALLRRLRQHTAMKVSLKRVSVDPARDDLSGYTFLYLAGLDDFRFSDEAVRALRQFVSRAGTLVVDNGLGLATFDAAARRELRRILPEAALAPLPPEHPIYRSVLPVGECRYTPAVTAVEPGLKIPSLEGIELDGNVRVVYSRFDLGAAWLGCEYPLARAYEPHSGMEVGVNMAVYAMTH